jgi:cytochrome c oxidase assembly protein subunit 11
VRSKLVTPSALILVVCGMLGAAFASPDLYRLFCSVTGYGGTPQTTFQEPTASDLEATITVRFSAETAPGLAWQFQPEQPSIRLRLGTEQIAFYRAKNVGDRPLTGIAVYNVTPDRVGRYFHKTACFCFSKQNLAPGQNMQFPLTFWVDPAIARDPDTKDVHTITLNYTFFHSLDEARIAGALAHAGPYVGPLRTAGAQ